MEKQRGGSPLKPHVEIDMERGSRSKKPLKSKFERSIIEEDKCIFCGNKTSERDLCRRCSISSTISPLSFIDLHFILPALSLIISFLFIQGKVILDMRLGLFSGNGYEMGFLLISLCLFSCFLLIMERRGSVMKPDNLKRSFFIILIPISILSFIPLLTMGVGPIQVMLPLLILPVVILLYALDRKNYSKKILLGLFVLILGSIMVCSGFGFSFSGMDIGSIIWFISGEHIALFGMLTMCIAAYRISDNLNASTRTTLSIIALTTSSSLLFIVAIGGSIFGERGYIDDTLALISLIVLAISIMAKINIRVKESMMASSLNMIETSLNRAAKLEKSGKDFYALQQYDMALKVNPIHELGRPYYQGSIISKLDNRTTRENLSFEPTEYEISYNEKAKILSSQSRWNEAAKQYNEAIRMRPDYIITYLELSMLLASIPGKNKESEEHLRFFIYSKKTYIKRWFKEDLSPEILHWIGRSFDLYIETLEKKLDLLHEMSSGGDIWAYYSLGKD